MALNPKKYIDKLIQALELEGKYYTYTYKRFYSNNVNRYVTKYMLVDKDDKSKTLEVYNKMEILKFLVREYYGVTGRPIPAELSAPLDEE